MTWPAAAGPPVLDGLAEMGRTLLYLAGLVLLIGVLSHALAWVFTRKRTVRWVWQTWNLLGAVLLLIGLAAIGYGWLVLGLQTGAGSAVAGLGLLLASAGLWMIVPV